MLAEFSSIFVAGTNIIYIYIAKEQFKMLIEFSSIFVAGTKIISCHNFGAPQNIIL